MTHYLPFFAYPVADDLNWVGLLALIAIIVLYPIFVNLEKRHIEYKYKAKQRRINKEVLKLYEIQRRRKI